MRTDATIDGRAVTCPNATLLGGATYTARVGSFLVYKEGEQTRYARMLGRIKFAPRLGAHDKPIKNHILVMSLSSSFQSCYERWIDPADVVEVRAEPPAALAAFFFAPKLPYGAQTMRRLMEHGTLQDQFISQHAARVAMFKKRERCPVCEDSACETKSKDCGKG